MYLCRKYNRILKSPANKTKNNLTVTDLKIKKKIEFQQQHLPLDDELKMFFSSVTFQ